LVEPLPKIPNRGSVLFGFLASLFALLQLEGKVIGALIGLRKALWQNKR
jgi:hypothetical protein